MVEASKGGVVGKVIGVGVVRRDWVNIEKNEEEILSIYLLIKYTFTYYRLQNYYYYYYS